MYPETLEKARTAAAEAYEKVKADPEKWKKRQEYNKRQCEEHKEERSEYHKKWLRENWEKRQEYYKQYHAKKKAEKLAAQAKETINE